MLLRSILAGLAVSGLICAGPALARPPAGEGAGGIFAKAPRPKPKRKKPPSNPPAEAAVASTMFPGLAPGLYVRTSTGVSLGTVSQVVTASDGSIQRVVVSGTNGTTYHLLPNHLSVEGGVVTTTQTDVGG